MAVDLSAADPERPDRAARHEVPPYEQVRQAARGSRRDYKLEPAPIAQGGQAEVFRGIHKPTRVPIAFKKLTSRSPDSVARMRREIEAARRFDGHQHVMPVLDADPEATWFVMPLASDTAQTLAAELTDPARLRELVTAVCLALRTAHCEGWIHRDLKPDNILRLDGQWKVADWGLGRRPRGQTSDHHRTAVGTHFGTLGFAAPELSISAHDAGPQADVYSIGQLIGWALTGRWPGANIPLLPDSEPWRAIARAATALELVDRPADAEELLALIEAELDCPESPVERGRLLAAVMADGDPAAPGALVRLAARAQADRHLFREVLVGLREPQLRAAVSADPMRARMMVRAVRTLPDGDTLRVIPWLLKVARVAEEFADWDLLAATTVSVLRSSRNEVGRLDVRSWLTTLSGEAASTVAAALSGHADARAWFGDQATRSRVDHQIQHVLRAAPRTPEDHPHVDSTPEVEQAARPRGPRMIIAASITAILVAVAVAIAVMVNQEPNTPAQGTRQTPGSSNVQNAPRLPTQMAGTPQLKLFVAPWDKYPTWAACRSEDRERTVNGSFPAAVADPINPSLGFSCDNGGNLTIMFGEFVIAGFYDDALQRYRSAPAPRRPVAEEARPPPEVHVFEWSDTHRGLVWTDEEAQAIGIVITDSATTDLVELWRKYRT